MTWLHIFKWPGIPTAKPTHLRHVWEHHRSPWAPGCSDRSIFIVRQLLGHHRWTQFNGKASKHPSKVACLKLSVWCFFFSKNSESFDEFFISTTKNGPTTFHTHTHTHPRSSSDTNHTRRRRPTKASSSAPASTFGPKQPKSPLERHRWFLKRSRIPFFVCFAA